MKNNSDRFADAKNYAEVLIDGKIYTLGGTEDEHYLQRVASYINEKTAQLKRQAGFTRQSEEYQAVMISLNIADDYFKAINRAAVSERQRDDMERESYGLKHELVTTQLRLENVMKDLEEKKDELDRVKKDLDRAHEELLKLKAVQAAGLGGMNPAGRR
ncbi:MAG: cell division protein ZapA [Hungatella sp.]|nr:cell division protein ZapA [Hungatella sp.]